MLIEDKRLQNIADTYRRVVAEVVSRTHHLELPETSVICGYSSGEGGTHIVSISLTAEGVGSLESRGEAEYFLTAIRKGVINAFNLLLQKLDPNLPPLGKT